MQIWASLLGGFMVATTLSPAARADETVAADAEQLAQEGAALWRSGDEAAARERYERAYRRSRAPSYGLWVGRSLERDRRWVEAAERYLELTQSQRPNDGTNDRALREQAAIERQQLLPRIPSVQILIAGAPPEQVELSFNGALVNGGWFSVQRPVDPGEFHVVGTYAGRKAEARAHLEEASQQTLRLSFPLPRPAMDDAQVTSMARNVDTSSSSSSAANRRVFGYVAMGVGGASLITGSVFGFLALSNRSDLKQRCPSERCPSNLQSDVEAYESNKTIAAVGLSAGLALGALGAVLYLSAKEQPTRSARVGLWYAGRSLGAWGAF